MVEREWREASDLRTSRIALAAVLLSAAVLRLWGVGRGIPYAVQIDEPEIVERAFNMMRSGSLHPHFFDYPGLSLYIQLVVSIARFVAGAISGEWYSLGQATAAILLSVGSRRDGLDRHGDRPRGLSNRDAVGRPPRASRGRARWRCCRFTSGTRISSSPIRHSPSSSR